MRKGIILTTFFSFVFILLTGCTTTLKQSPITFSGTYKGKTSDGQIVTFTLVEKDLTVTGQGIIKGKKVGLSGIVLKQGIGIIMLANGSYKPANYKLSSDGRTITIKGLKESLVLRQQNVTSPVRKGPLTGLYESEDKKALWISLDLIQHGKILYGTATIWGGTASIAGRLISAGSAEGVIFYPDQGQKKLKIKISADKRKIKILGMGQPLTLIKKK